MKKKVAVAPIVAGILAILGGVFISVPYWQSIVGSCGVGLVFLGIGIFVVNVMLERHDRSQAVGSILKMANDAIASFHNRFLDLVWTAYSKDDFSKIGVGYLKSNGDIKSIPPDDRSKIYGIFRDKRSELTNLAAELEPILMETTSLAGWNLDPIILSACLEARQSLRKFTQCKFDGTDTDRDNVVEQILDLHAHTQTVRRKLLELSGIKDG